jgi:predicted Fe-Mo cluster-binding NifX family protein
MKGKTMKIAVPTTQDGKVDSHFGHAEKFTIYDISEKNEILSNEVIQSCEGCGCKSNIVFTLSQMGVSVMLAGNMGEGAVNVLGSNGIKVIRGCDGEINLVVNQYLSGAINDSGELCAHHH